MVREISPEAWEQYKALLPSTREIYIPALPVNLSYQGKVQGSFDYVLPEEVLEQLRAWLQSRGEEFVYFFKTEGIAGEATNFEVHVAELTHESLSKIDVHCENALAGKDFTWAIFVDHEGDLHVSGPPELMAAFHQGA